MKSVSSAQFIHTGSLRQLPRSISMHLCDEPRPEPRLHAQRLVQPMLPPPDHAVPPQEAEEITLLIHADDIGRRARCSFPRSHARSRRARIAVGKLAV